MQVMFKGENGALLGFFKKKKKLWNLNSTHTKDILTNEETYTFKIKLKTIHACLLFDILLRTDHDQFHIHVCVRDMYISN